MKRLLWLFLAVLCPALAQVQLAGLPQAKAIHGCCVGCLRPCCTPDCAMLPTAVHQPTVLESNPAETDHRTRRNAARLPTSEPAFYLSLLEPVVATTTLPAPAWLAPAASPPLFQVHCSFRI